MAKQKQRKSRKSLMLNTTNKKLFFVLTFLIRFLVMVIPLYLLMYFKVKLFYLGYLEAQAVTFILNMFGINSITLIEWGFPVIAVGNLNQSILIDSACTGYRSILALTGLIIAVPNISWKKRLKGILYGSLILFAVNILRISTTIILGHYFGIKVFEFAHTLLWREGLIFVVLLLWYIWLKKQKIKLK